MGKKKVVIHHSATKDGLIVDFNAIKNYHVNVLGNVDIGYNHVIERVNSKWEILPGRPENIDGAHTKGDGMNKVAIGVCVVGNFDLAPPPDEAFEKLIELLSRIKAREGSIEITGHNEHNATSCPGKYFPMDSIKYRMSSNPVHWAEIHYNQLKVKGIEITEKRFDDPITRGEVFALLNKIVK